eukprot:scaffold25947_cov62-Phaeocystis_antarctica.AAC.1
MVSLYTVGARRRPGSSQYSVPSAARRWRRSRSPTTPAASPAAPPAISSKPAPKPPSKGSEVQIESSILINQLVIARQSPEHKPIPLMRPEPLLSRALRNGLTRHSAGPGIGKDAAVVHATDALGHELLHLGPLVVEIGARQRVAS